MRNAKIVCTIGPASSDPETLRDLVRTGMDVARLNFSHGTHQTHAATIAEVRAAASETGRPVAILQDLSGPKIRIGALRGGAVELTAGQVFVLTTRAGEGDAGGAAVTYAGLPGDVDAGDPLLLNDGALELRVEETTPDSIVCRVIVGGSLSSHKGINLPTRSVSAPFPTQKDLHDLAFGLEHGVDYVALSFVRNARDVELIRERTSQAGRGTPLIAKIERHEALHAIDEILAAADGIMIARGDLGVEIPIERIPQAQRTLIEKANAAAKPVITATQMLRSMVASPRPTRAEVTDVANAIVAGSDAVMLSEETAVGAYPVESVRMMQRIAANACTPPCATGSPGTDGELPMDEAVARSAARLAAGIRARAVITCTHSGSTSRLVAKYRPPVPIIGATPNEATCRQLALVWGVTPLSMAPADTPDEVEREVLAAATAAGLLDSGDTVVLTAGVPLHKPGTTNMIKVATV